MRFYECSRCQGAAEVLVKGHQFCFDCDAEVIRAAVEDARLEASWWRASSPLIQPHVCAVCGAIVEHRATHQVWHLTREEKP